MEWSYRGEERVRTNTHNTQQRKPLATQAQHILLILNKNKEIKLKTKKDFEELKKNK